MIRIVNQIALPLDVIIQSKLEGPPFPSIFQTPSVFTEFLILRTASQVFLVKQIL